MQLSLSSRNSALVSLVGIVLSIVGFFLPMFIESNPQVLGSAHPVYEWQVVTIFSSLVPVVTFFALLPLLCMLIILIVSSMALFRVPALKWVWLQRAAAGWGLVIQLLFAIFIFVSSLIGYARIDLSWGFMIVPIGFVIMLVGCFTNSDH